MDALSGTRLSRAISAARADESCLCPSISSPPKTSEPIFPQPELLPARTATCDESRYECCIPTCAQVTPIKERRKNAKTQLKPFFSSLLFPVSPLFHPFHEGHSYRHTLAAQRNSEHVRCPLNALVQLWTPFLAAQPRGHQLLVLAGGGEV